MSVKGGCPASLKAGHSRFRHPARPQRRHTPRRILYRIRFDRSSGSNPTLAGFGGQFGYYTDTETGLLCLTHRYYDPGTGKFINRDPIGYAGGANLDGFCDGNPVNESDPSGMIVEVRRVGPHESRRQ